MSLTPDDRHTMDYDRALLNRDERDLVDEVFITIYSSNVPAATDDRAAALEAALVRFLIVSRPTEAQ